MLSVSLCPLSSLSWQGRGSTHSYLGTYQSRVYYYYFSSNADYDYLVYLTEWKDDIKSQT